MPETVTAQEQVKASFPAQRELLIARADEKGRPLRLRCVVTPEDLWDPLATRDGKGVALRIHDGEGIALMTLEPGHYRVMVYADPGPFGFDVVVPPERSVVEVQIFSKGSGHTVVTETRREPIGEGVVMVERQILGFGWGPRPGPSTPGNSLAERVKRADRNEAEGQAAQISAARRRDTGVSATPPRDAWLRRAVGTNASLRGGEFAVAP
jgi:hypothetical protein